MSRAPRIWSSRSTLSPARSSGPHREAATERGLTYWESKDRADRRLILTTNSGLREIDAKTGQLIRTFGVNGTVDMRAGTPAASVDRTRVLAASSRISSSSVRTRARDTARRLVTFGRST